MLRRARVTPSSSSDDEVGGRSRAPHERSEQINPLQPRQSLQKHVERSGQPGRCAGQQQVQIADKSTAGEECHPEQDLLGRGLRPVAIQLLLEPHHELVGPFELAGPHGQAEQDQWDAARTWDGTADEAKGDKEETEEADSDAVNSQLASVLSDLATPAPVVLLRLDEDVVVVLVWEVARLVRSRAGLWQGRGGNISVARAVVADAG